MEAKEGYGAGDGGEDYCHESAAYRQPVVDAEGQDEEGRDDEAAASTDEGAVGAGAEAQGY